LALRDFASLSPLLKQPFFIGDGSERRNDGSAFFHPIRRYPPVSRTMDGFEWVGNTGSLDVTVTETPAPAVPVPEPSTIALAASA